MERLNLTDAQREQIVAAQAAGQKRVHVQTTPEQREYLKRAQAEEAAAAQSNIDQAREGLLRALTNRIDRMEAAMRAMLAGRADEAKACLERSVT